MASSQFYYRKNRNFIMAVVSGAQFYELSRHVRVLFASCNTV